MTDSTAVAHGLLTDRCPQPSPLPMLSEPRCKLAVGHEPPHRFTSHGGRTDLQQFPTAKELAR